MAIYLYRVLNIFLIICQSVNLLFYFYMWMISYIEIMKCMDLVRLHEKRKKKTSNLSGKTTPES